ncbi:peroxisomal membrane protein PEX16 [Drosophila sulfurigaster albostrigata]|uniref:peroxisomal membrane protein PEX16 n=1 Tax=Drosophila sulfurigaster albostrigata TaxID=89887 RepID=UPI002D21C5DA|nr:peroxisomal membrane protein PEX16 [Drosophila sulfurigaster albostrigata]
MDQLKGLVKAYEAWVAKNPDVVGDFETTAKWVSYFVAGRISNSNVLSELVYTLSNILVFYNDRIIDRARAVNDNAVIRLQTGLCYRLKVTLTTLEYCEVFIEISARRLFGQKGKWLVIALIQLAKAAGRLFLLKHSTLDIITSPPITALNRRVLSKQRQAASATAATDSLSQSEHSITFQLKRSGRIIRKVEGAPPIQYRDFKLHVDNADAAKTQMPRELLQAEYLYIAKPLVHLAAMGLFGQRSWKQYMVALSIDLYSVHVYRQHRHLMSKQQKLELSRRCVNLLYFLVRSPFYDNYSKSRIERVLGFVAQHVPIAKVVAGPIKDYIPQWQNTYFYLWST